MTQEEKNLLVKDICARLPYGVYIHLDNGGGYKPFDAKLRGLTEDNDITEIKSIICWHYDELCKVSIEECKLYLRPMSSMTEEEKRTYLTLRAHALPFSIVEWLDEKHFDHRTNMNGEHLIEIGLALEAPEDMYKTE